MKSYSSKKIGVLLVNLGTPNSPEPADVGRYLREFLMDPLVIDIPYPLRWFLVNVLIVPRRAKASSQLYKKIWSDEGSPLLFHTVALASKVQRLMGDTVVIRPAMRYGQPSLKSAFASLLEAGVSEVRVLPLYPQYSSAATESTIKEASRVSQAIGAQVPLKFLPAFYQNTAYLDAVAKVSRPYLEKSPYDLALFSFHGLPERQVKKTDRHGNHCLNKNACCEAAHQANVDCYRHHCYVTAREVAGRLGLKEEQYVVGFQSRLGRTPWIKPYSDEFYRTLPSQGVKRLAVLSPSFVADCLETLEEVQIRGKEEFKANGGEDLFLVPSLNAADVWAEGVCTLLDSI